MNNYDSLRSSVGTTNSKYFLKQLDYLTRRSGPTTDYTRDRNYTHGSKPYDTGQYSSGYASYGYDKNNYDYKSKYDNYESDSYLRANKKADMRDLRSTTNVLPSYYTDQRDKDFTTHSPRREHEKDYYQRERKGTRTFYDGPTTLKTSKQTSPKRLDGLDKAKYLSPGKYDSVGASSSALSPNRYNPPSSSSKYQSSSTNQKLAAMLDKFKQQQSPSSGSSSTARPPNPTSPKPTSDSDWKQDLKKKYLNTTTMPKYTSDYNKYDDAKLKPTTEDYQKLYSSTSSASTNYNAEKKYGETDYSLLADSKSNEIFRKKKDYRDVKSPDKEANGMKVGLYGTGITTSNNVKKEPEITGSKANDLKVTSKDTKQQITSKTIRETKDDKKPSPFSKSPSPTSPHLSPTNSKVESKVSIRDFEIIKNKGQGKFGQVFLAKHKVNNTLYALKKIPKQVIKDHHMEDQLILEIKLQAFMDHPNILKLYTFFHDYENIYLVLEYMEQGTLFEHLKKRKDRMTEAQVSRHINQISKGIKYLHDLDIAHRDIKPQNIVLTHGKAKLCDFGWATRCTSRRRTYCGTFDYVAPEIFEGKQYDWCVDLWCLGVLTYQLLTGKVPFYNISRKQTMKKILSVDKQEISFSGDISWEARDFVECLIKKAPEERRRADQLLTHPFLEKYQEPELRDIKF